MKHKRLLGTVLAVSLLAAACSSSDDGNALDFPSTAPAVEAELTNGPAPPDTALGELPEDALPDGQFPPPPQGGAPTDPQVPQQTAPEQAAAEVFDPAADALDAGTSGLPYTIVDTGQAAFYDEDSQIAEPADGSAFDGQDASYDGVDFAYVDNGDGTVTDLNTGLMWASDPGEKVTWAEAMAGAEDYSLAGYDDWRLPTVKELYSLITFSGSSVASIPYIDTDYFEFAYGDESAGERAIDSQWWTSTKYVSTVFDGKDAAFGVNFADGRIKGYPTDTGPGGQPKLNYALYVRGNTDYGENDFADNGDGTVTDAATGLMWQQDDGGLTLDWVEALSYCESATTAGYDDWRLPNAKELQSIVDYSRSPDTTGTAAIDPVFDVSDIQGWYWSSTTLLESPDGSQAVYVTFGEATGIYSGEAIDVHGAGAQRSDPKTGDASAYADGFGPQNDEIRIDNYVRCVRDA